MSLDDYYKQQEALAIEAGQKKIDEGHRQLTEAIDQASRLEALAKKLLEQLILMGQTLEDANPAAMAQVKLPPIPTGQVKSAADALTQALRDVL